MKVFKLLLAQPKIFLLRHCMYQYITSRTEISRFIVHLDSFESFLVKNVKVN